eukprot:3787259-Amphidinium_carterae.1
MSLWGTKCLNVLGNMLNFTLGNTQVRTALVIPIRTVLTLVKASWAMIGRRYETDEVLNISSQGQSLPTIECLLLPQCSTRLQSIEWTLKAA